MAYQGINIDNDSSGLAIMAIAGLTSLGDATYHSAAYTEQYVPGNGERQLHPGFPQHQDRGRRAAPPDECLPECDIQGAVQFRCEPYQRPLRSVHREAATRRLRSCWGIQPPLRAVSSLCIPDCETGRRTHTFRTTGGSTHWLTLNIGIPVGLLRRDFGSCQPHCQRRPGARARSSSPARTASPPRPTSSRTTGPLRPDSDSRPTLAKGTVLRGGYGLSFNPNMLASNMAMRNPPFVSLYNVNATPLAPSNRLQTACRHRCHATLSTRPAA